jgi:outer membrane cobalamin receptor
MLNTMRSVGVILVYLTAVVRLVAQAQPPANGSGQPEPKPEPVKTSITVVENVSAETPANVTVMDAAAVQDTAGTNLDDRLRDVPGFTLFKRSSSVVAHPTTQGVSLRGLGSSGASRTLVLWDGVPVNDPFGGWVYWTQFIPDEIQDVEISRGAATSVFGDRAMSGAIAIFSEPPEKLHLLGDYETGNRDTQDVSAGFSDLWPRVAVTVNARGFTTDGYYIVPEPIRGAVDRMANVRFATGDVHVDHFTSAGNLFFRLDMLAEERGNGTELTHNSTGLGLASLHYVRDFGNNSLSLIGYGTEEGFHSTFSTVLNNRNTERLTYTQSVPSQAEGGAALWQRHQSRWNLMAGTDVARVHGIDTDYLRPTGLRVGGGSQLQNGIFGQVDGELGAFHLYGGARGSFAGQGTQHTSFLSPSAGVAYGRHRWRLRGSVYRAFRAPTLNELYRSFSVGNTFTESNPNLVAETMTGGEAGADWTGETTSFRVTAYRNSLDNLITNITLSSTPSQIVRQRANEAAAVSQGVETEFHKRFHDLSAEVSYLFVDARYSTGYRISQVPKHQGSGGVVYQHGSTMLSVDLRAFDYQFDDDLNQFRLPGFATLQFVGRQRLTRHLSAEVALENALDRTYYTAFTPTPNVGEPRLWRVGLKWDGKLR